MASTSARRIFPWLPRGRSSAPTRSSASPPTTTQQIDEALAGDASYIAVGPVFLTATKETGYTPRSLDLVSYAARRGKPVVAIGGITLERAPEVVAAGATGSRSSPIFL